MGKGQNSPHESKLRLSASFPDKRGNKWSMPRTQGAIHSAMEIFLRRNKDLHNMILGILRVLHTYGHSRRQKDRESSRQVELLIENLTQKKETGDRAQTGGQRQRD